MTLLAIILLALPTAACGKQPNDPALARQLADYTFRQCGTARSQAPNAAFAHHLDRLCKCAHDKIAATPMSRSDSQQMRYGKVQAVLQACSDQLGGVADAEDYRATGIQPPENSTSK